VHSQAEISGVNRIEKFSFPMDRLAWFITAGVVALTVFVTLTIRKFLFSQVGILLIPGLAILVLLFFLLSPVSLLLKEEELVIKTLLFKKRIPLREIEEVRKITPQELSRAIRLFSSFGYFGYNGIVKIGKERAWIFARARGEGVFIKTKQGNYILVVRPLERLYKILKEGR